MEVSHIQDDDDGSLDTFPNGDVDVDIQFRGALQQNGSFFARLRRIITVEPPVFLFMFAVGIHGPALQGLTYHKVCIMDFEFDHSICGNLKNDSFQTEEDIVQTGSSHWFLYQNLCFEIPAIILSFFYGSISDHFSRKLALALPLIGQILAMTNYIINATYMNIHVGYILISQVVSGCFGGWITFLLSVFSYLSEVSTKQSRTNRIAIAEAVISLSIAASYFVSGMILDHTSYTFVFSLSLGLYILGIVYIYTWLQVLPKEHDEQRLGVLRRLRAVFTWEKLVDSFMCMFKKRQHGNRKRVLLLLLCVFTSAVSYNALYTLGYLFLKRHPLSWSQTMFGIYIGINKASSGLALLVFIPLLKYKLKMSDTSIILIGIVSSSAGELIFGLSTKTWISFLVPLVGIMGDAKMTGMRSMLSSFVEPHELGKMFAAVGSVQSLSMIVGAALFNSIYPLTLSWWPGFSFSLGVAASVIPFSIIWWLHRNLKSSTRYSRLDEDIIHDVPGGMTLSDPLIEEIDHNMSDELELSMEDIHPISL